MPLESAWPVPFLLDPLHLEVGSATGFCISVLLAVLVNAEGQAFTATILGDARQNPQDRFHFNAFLHLSLLGYPVPSARHRRTNSDPLRPRSHQES
jgi:hypothetical protein